MVDLLAGHDERVAGHHRLDREERDDAGRPSTRSGPGSSPSMMRLKMRRHRSSVPATRRVRPGRRRPPARRTARREPGGGTVLGDRPGDDVVDRAGCDQRDHATAEAGAGETRAVRARRRRATSTSTSSSGVETSKSSRERRVARRASARRTARCRPLRSASTNASTRAFSDTTWRAIGSSATCSSVASRSAGTPMRSAAAAHARGAARAYALSSSRRAMPAVHHEDRDARRERDRLDREAPAVEQQRVAGAPEHGRHLVHHPARHTGTRLLGLLRDDASATPAEMPVAGRRRCAHDGRDLERRARRQARADRHGRVTAASNPPRCRPGRENPPMPRERAPHARLDRARVRRRRRPGSRRCRRASSECAHDEPVVARPDADDDLAVDRHREAEPVLVVGVVTDQVAPGRAPRTVRTPKSYGCKRVLLTGPRSRSPGDGRSMPPDAPSRISTSPLAATLDADRTTLGGRFQNSMALAKSSWQVLRDDKQLTMLPLFSLLDVADRGRRGRLRSRSASIAAHGSERLSRGSKPLVWVLGVPRRARVHVHRRSSSTPRSSSPPNSRCQGEPVTVGEATPRRRCSARTCCCRGRS